MCELMVRYNELEIYNTVLSLAESKGIQIKLNIDKSGDMIEYGYTHIDEKNRKINIVIKDEAVEQEEVFVHELLHAKLFLEGYPLPKLYNFIEINPFIDKVLESVNNTIQHTYVYRNMKHMGYNQNDINKHFFEFVKESIEVQSQGAAKLGHAVNFLELYLRNVSDFESIKFELSEKQPDAFSLFLKMKKAINGINTPYSMRVAYAKVYKLINEFILETEKENMHLNIIIAVSPVFLDSQLDGKASQSLYTVKFTGYPTVFVLDKAYNQCCYFFSNDGQNLDKQIVDTFLEQSTLRKIIEIHS